MMPTAITHLQPLCLCTVCGASTGCIFNRLTMLKLEFKNRGGDPIWIVDKSFAIGSAADNQLVIDDGSVSPQHARIVRNDGCYCLRDLGSTTGVYVNEQRINHKEIDDGDAIRLGDIELLVVDPLAGRNQKHWSLIACSNWLSGREFALPKHTRDGTIKVGRSSSCDIVFPGTHLSREHVELRIGDDHLLVRDLDSANGTFINDERVNEGTVYPGDKLRLDIYSFQILGPAPARAVNSKTAKPAFVAQQSAGPPLRNSSSAARNWKTRPTSPGNRDDQSYGGRENMALIVVAAVLCVAVTGLGFYLFLG